MLVKHAQLPGWTRESQQAATASGINARVAGKKNQRPRKSHVSNAKCKVEWLHLEPGDKYAHLRRVEAPAETAAPGKARQTRSNDRLGPF